MKIARFVTLAVVALTLTACAGMLGGLGDFFKGVASPGVAVPGNEWKLNDSYVVSEPEVTLRSDAPPGVMAPDGDPECSLRVCTTIEACMSVLSAQLGDQSMPESSRPAGVVSLVFGVNKSGAGDRVLYNLCREAKIGERFPHLDGHFDLSDRRVVDDANRGTVAR